MSEDSFEIAAMTRDEINLAVEWAALEGWNPGLHDAESFCATDATGFIVGRLNGEPISSISAVKYGKTFGFIGFYIVKPEYRGLGYGIQTWDAAIHYLNGRNIGLDGVVDQQENYRKSGFKLAYNNIRYEGKGGGDAPRDENLVDRENVPFAEIAAYDRQFFPEDRSDFLKSWLDRPDQFSVVAIKDGAISGYGVLRACRTGFKVGPLFADSEAVAESIFDCLRSKVTPDDLIYLDTPEANRAAVSLAERNGMWVVFETARMYTQQIPNLPLERLFGVTTFELG